MRFLILIALCLAVASASYSNRHRFNRLLRQLQHQQQQEQGYGPQGYSYNDQYESEDQDNEDDEDNYYQQQRYQQNQHHQRSQRNQRYGNLNNLNDDENDYDNDNNQYDTQYQRQQGDEDQDQNQNQHQRQGRQGRHHGQRQYDDQYQQQQDDEDQYQNQYQRQGRHQGQRHHENRRQEQQQHQCQARHQLLEALEDANTQLASKLYKQAKQENDDKNTVVSPAAVQLALAAIQRGARGNTKRQIQRVIGAGLNQQQNREAHAALQQSLHGQDSQQQQYGQYGQGQNGQAQIKTTTTIIVNQQSRAQHRFIQAVRACLNVQVKTCNFHRQPQQCRQQINRHVAQKTHHKLQHIVPQDAVTENTKLVVVNTAQLNAKWSRQVRQTQQTKQGRFYPLGSQQPKQVQVLQTRGQFNYYEDEQTQVVGLPTQQQELTLYLIVPKNKDGLNQVEKSQIQNGQQLKQLLENAEQQQEQIDLELPKFQIRHKIDAKQTLQKEGIQDAFDADEADLSGINGQQQQEHQRRRRHHQQRNQYNGDEEQDQEQDQYNQHQQREQQLHVNKLIHQATIKITEQGIRAANPRHQGQGQNQNQYEQQYENEQYQGQDQDESEDDQEDEQELQYRNQQEERQEFLEEIFGQRQQRHGRNQHQNRRHHQRNQGQNQGELKVKVNRAFAFAVKHNPSNQIVLVGRVVDATQRPNHHQQQGRQQGQQSLNGVDQQ